MLEYLIMEDWVGCVLLQALLVVIFFLFLFFQVPDLISFNNSMTYISLKYNRLKAVNLDYFSDFPLMRTLMFTSNQITTINLTKPITPLYLYFDNNRLISIDMNIFSVISEIAYLTFKSNPLTEFIYPSSNGTVMLSKLSLSYTQVINEHVKVQNFSGLTHFELQYAHVSTFNYTMFVDLKELLHLNLKGNYILEIAPVASGTFLDKLNKLILGMCNIPGTFNLSQVSTVILPALTYLDLHHNQLESLFIEDGYNLSSLIHFRLDSNLITEFDLDFYSGVFPQLVTLNLRYNDITQVTFVQFLCILDWILRFKFIFKCNPLFIHHCREIILQATEIKYLIFINKTLLLLLIYIKRRTTWIFRHKNCDLYEKARDF